MRDMLEARKRGDLAFRDRDFKTAIDCYSQVCALWKDFLGTHFIPPPQVQAFGNAWTGVC